MTEVQRQRIKAALIEGELFKLLGRAKGKVHLWMNDNGTSLIFSTNNLAEGPGLIVKKIPVPSDTVDGTKILEEWRDAVKAFLMELIGAESPEVERLIGAAHQVAELPKVRVQVTKKDGLLTVRGTDFNEVGTDGVMIGGCRIQRPMQIVAHIGGEAELEISLAPSDYQFFEVKKWYFLIYRRPAGFAVGMAHVAPAC